ncbi:MAG: hypothetical protein A2138_26450 [Deltaproteobacteria bacterium RBG_16_71_12]|nr:MAG: hypothetical protein A2138_26450 [Deltaproteobacteria bacterium RBG_16_71_12]
MTRLTSLLAANAALATLAACPGGGHDTEPPEVLVIGADRDASACTTDVDCPPDFSCDALGVCRAIDWDGDNDGFDDRVDCDDLDAARHPAATEDCNGVDDDCDGVTDEGVANACGACGAAAAEVCDLVDNDCDDQVDEECAAGSFDENEPNDGVGCQPIALPIAVGDSASYSGAFDPAGDVDSFCFFVRAGTTIFFDVDSASLGAPTDAVLALFQANGAQLPGGANDFGDGADPQLAYTFPRDENVRLDLYNFEDDQGGATLTWQLHLRLDAHVACDDLDGDGRSGCDGDCDDDDPLVFPGQTEVCDGTDNNCDGTIDTDALGGCPTAARPELEPNDSRETCQLFTAPFEIEGVINPARDKDVFCIFVASGTELSFDIDAREPPGTSLLDAKLRLLDAQLQQLALNLEAPDPDTGVVPGSDGDSALTFTFAQPGIYHIEVADERTTGGGTRFTYTLRTRVLSAAPCTDGDADGVATCEGDCDDDDASVHFGAPELCDAQDNDCDGVGDPEDCTGDFDGDGVAGIAGDCADDDPTRRPGQVERCNGVDDDCDGAVDEGLQNACGTCGFAPAERCNGGDDDCDGVIDEGCAADGDGDGARPDDGDCDDTDPAVGPGALEVCDGIDNDCDGAIDEFVKNACGACAPEPVEQCNGLDDDCDGRIDDDALNRCGLCGPVPPETCNGIDDDCNGEVDEGVANRCGGCGPEPAEICNYVDDDCDGTTDEGCDVDLDGDGLTQRQGDCAPTDASARAGITETCGDDRDVNCDGHLDDGCAPRDESEPNDVRTSCDALPLPGRAYGELPAGDSDFFCVSAPVAGAVLRIDVDADVLGSPLDAALRFYDASGTLLASNGNTVVDGQFSPDPLVEIAVEDAGSYVVEVVRASASSSATPFYQLLTSVIGGCTDLDRDGFLRCDDDCDDEDATRNPGAAEVCNAVDDNCAAGVDETCVGGCLDDALEQNDTPATAAALSPGSVANLRMCLGDPDYHSIGLTAGQHLIAEVLFSLAEANLTLEILSPTGAVLAVSADAGNNESVEITAAVSGSYFVRVTGPFFAEAGYQLVLVLSGSP